MKIINKIELEQIIDKNLEILKKTNCVSSIFYDNVLIDNMILIKKGHSVFTGENIGLKACVFIETDVGESYLRGSSFIENCIFLNCNLNYMYLEGYISNCKFISCSLLETDFQEIEIDNSIFVECDFSAARFQGAILTDVEFINSNNLLKENVFKDSVEKNVKWI